MRLGPGDLRTWVGRTEACEALGVSKTKLARMVEDRLVRSMTTPGSSESRRYSVEDIRAILADRRAEGDLIVYHEDGSESFNLNGRVADWKAETLIGRADSCWVFLTAHGYLKKDCSEATRELILQDVRRSGQSHRFRCADATAMKPFKVYDTPMLDRPVTKEQHEALIRIECEATAKPEEDR